MKWIIFTLNFLLTYKTFSQTIDFGYGPIFTQSVQKVKLVNGVNDFQNTGFNFIIGYAHKLKFKNSEIVSTFNYFPGETWMTIDKSKALYEYGNGFKGLKVFRIDFYYQYEFIKYNKIFFKTGVGLGAQLSKRNGYDPFDSVYEIFGPEYSMTEPISIKYNFFQLVPLLNLKIGFVFFKRIELFLNIQGVCGTKAYQTMQLNYSYKGIPQESGIIEAKGTGLFPSFGIGYKFVK